MWHWALHPAPQRQSASTVFANVPINHQGSIILRWPTQGAKRRQSVKASVPNTVPSEVWPRAASVAEEWTFRVSRLARHAPGGNGPGPCLRASAHEHYYRLGSLPVESDDFLASNHLKLFKLFCGVP